MSLGYSSNMRTTIDPQGLTSPTEPCGLGTFYCHRATMATALLVKTIEEVIVGSLLTIFVPHAIEALLNSQKTQDFLVGRLT